MCTITAKACVVAALLLSASAFGALDDYTRTEEQVSEGLTLVRWTNKENSNKKAHALVFDLTTGKFAFRSKAGNGEEKRTVQTTAVLMEAVDEKPIAGINVSCFVSTSNMELDGWGAIISNGELIYPGYGYDSWAPHNNNFLMELTDGTLAIGTPTRADGKYTATIESADDITYNGKGILNCNMLNLGAGPQGKPGIIVENGVYIGVDTQTNYPRPLYGIADGLLVLFVSENGSKNGQAPVEADCAAMMIAEGCRTVGSGDGGGSASLWLKDSEKKFTNSYSFLNRPENCQPRAVPDSFFVVEAPPPLPEGACRVSELTISGYAGAETQKDFPVLVRLKENNPRGFTYGDVVNKQIRFADLNGNVLPHEIDTWNVNGTSLVWVKVPSLAGTSTKIKMYYGFERAHRSPDSVWSDYAGVWHLTDLADSGTNQLDATAGAYSAPYAAGVIGGAYEPCAQGGRNTSTITVSLADEAKRAAVDALGTTFTASFWMRSTVWIADWEWIISRKVNGDGSGWGIMQGGDWSSYANAWRIFAGGGYAESAKLENDPTGASRWAKVDLMYDGAKYQLYLDGALASSGDLPQTVDNSTVAALGFGGCTAGSFSMHGQLDEIRLYAGNPSADRVAAAYSNEADADFVTAGAVSVVETLPEFLVPGEDDPEEPGEDPDEPDQPGDDPEDPPDEPVVPVEVSLDPMAKYFTHRLPITVVGYAGETALADFPVLVRLANTIPGFDTTRANPAELYFADVEGNALAYDVDTWNPEGESLVWVRVKELAPDVDTTISLYYGSTGKETPKPTVDCWTGYAGVWHLGDLKDATANGLDATAGAGSAAYEQGAIGGAYRINNGYRNGKGGLDISLADAGKRAAVDALGTTFTAQFWMRRETSFDWATLLSRNANNSSPSWAIGQQGDWSGGSKAYRVINGSVSTETAEIEPIAGCYEKWAACTVVFDGANYTFYWNGNFVETKAIGGGAVNNDSPYLAIGYNSSAEGVGAVSAFQGEMDEVRLSAGVRSADWIKAEYANATDPGFVRVGSARPLVDGKLFTRMATFKTAGYTGRARLMDFPVLVRLAEDSPAGFRYAKCDPVGLRFADHTGGIIPHEIDTWNPQGESLVWVKVPQVANAESAFLMFYGGEKAAEAAVSDESVWSGYAGVWHLSDKSDASASGMDLTEVDSASPLAAGFIGGGYAFNGGGMKTTLDDYAAVNAQLGTEFSASAWYRLRNNRWSRLITRTWQFTDSGEYIWAYYLNGDWSYDGAINARVTGLEMTGKAGADNVSNFSSPVWVKADLQMCVETPGATTCRVYVNGELVDTYVVNAEIKSDGNGYPFGLGVSPGDGQLSFYGDMDEVRLRGGTLSADWVKAAYLNESGAGFLSCDGVGRAPGASAGSLLFLR